MLATADFNVTATATKRLNRDGRFNKVHSPASLLIAAGSDGENKRGVGLSIYLIASIWVKGACVFSFLLPRT